MMTQMMRGVTVTKMMRGVQSNVQRVRVRPVQVALAAVLFGYAFAAGLPAKCSNCTLSFNIEQSYVESHSKTKERLQNALVNYSQYKYGYWTTNASQANVKSYSVSKLFKELRVPWNEIGKKLDRTKTFRCKTCREIPLLHGMLISFPHAWNGFRWLPWSRKCINGQSSARKCWSKQPIQGECQARNNFSLFTKKRNCMGCGWVCCDNCSKKTTFAILKHDNGTRLSVDMPLEKRTPPAQRLCLRCRLHLVLNGVIGIHPGDDASFEATKAELKAALDATTCPRCKGKGKTGWSMKSSRCKTCGGTGNVAKDMQKFLGLVNPP